MGLIQTKLYNLVLSCSMCLHVWLCMQPLNSMVKLSLRSPRFDSRPVITQISLDFLSRSFQYLDSALNKPPQFCSHLMIYNQLPTKSYVIWSAGKALLNKQQSNLNSCHYTTTWFCVWTSPCDPATARMQRFKRGASDVSNHAGGSALHER
jgi:hypothetical protein